MLFRLSDVYKSYGAQDVLRGVSLQINPAEHVGLVGRNGAGKTTIFRLVTGEETIDGGDVVRAGLRLVEPGVLLLDEPTHRLDVAAVEWLEEFLRSYASAFVIISHDRYVLDRACRRIIEVENGQAASYKGNYSDFLVEREERREIQQRAYENQQRLIAKTEEFIRKNLAGQKTKQATSRRTMLQRLERVDAVRADQSSGDCRLQQTEATGTHVLTINETGTGDGEEILARELSLILRRM